MENTNQFLGTERVGKLMRRYTVPCIISLLVGTLYNIVDRSSSPTQATSVPTATRQTPSSFRSRSWRSPSP
jgi:hypothetical protein